MVKNGLSITLIFSALEHGFALYEAMKTISLQRKHAKYPNYKILGKNPMIQGSHIGKMSKIWFLINE